MVVIFIVLYIYILIFYYIRVALSITDLHDFRINYITYTIMILYILSSYIYIYISHV